MLIPLHNERVCARINSGGVGDWEGKGREKRWVMMAFWILLIFEKGNFDFCLIWGSFFGEMKSRGFEEKVGVGGSR